MIMIKLRVFLYQIIKFILRTKSFVGFKIVFLLLLNFLLYTGDG
jgi:hypothetical protein